MVRRGVAALDNNVVVFAVVSNEEVFVTSTCECGWKSMAVRKSGCVGNCVNIFVVVRGLVVWVLRCVAGLSGVVGFVVSLFCSFCGAV